MLYKAKIVFKTPIFCKIFCFLYRSFVYILYIYVYIYIYIYLGGIFLVTPSFLFKKFVLSTWWLGLCIGLFSWSGLNSEHNHDCMLEKLAKLQTKINYLYYFLKQPSNFHSDTQQMLRLFPREISNFSNVRQQIIAGAKLS